MHLNQGFTSGVNIDISTENAALAEVVHMSGCTALKVDSSAEYISLM